MGGALEIEVEVIGASPILKAFRALPKEASAQLRDRTQEIAAELAPVIAAAGRGEGGQAAAVATTVKARRDRVPVVAVGGKKRITRNRVPAGLLLYGSEFGAKRPQFRPHLGAGSYWFFETSEANDSEVYASWMRVAEEILATFGGVEG